MSMKRFSPLAWIVMAWLGTCGAEEAPSFVQVPASTFVSSLNGPTTMKAFEVMTQPVKHHSTTLTGLSWFEAEAYCQHLHARLPTWNEWEMLAASTPVSKDARSSPLQEEVWLRDGTARALEAAALIPNLYGVAGVHASHWEWVEDHEGLLSSADRRTGANASGLEFCGSAGSLMYNKNDYPVFQRLVVLSGLSPFEHYPFMQFRCARAKEES